MQKNNCYFTDSNTRPPAATIKPRLTVTPRVLIYSAHQVNKYRRGSAKAASPQTNQTPPTATTSASRRPQPHPTTSNPTSNHIQPPQSLPTTTIHTHAPTPHPHEMPTTRSQQRTTRSGGKNAPAPAKRAATAKTRSKGRKNKATSDEEMEGGEVDGKQGSGGKKNRKKNKYAPSPPRFRR